MLKHPLGGRYQDSTRSLEGTSLFVFMNISRKDTNCILITYPVQTKLKWTTKRAGSGEGCEKCGLGEEKNTLSHFTESSEMLCIITQKCKVQNIIFPTQLLYLHFLLAIFMKVLSRLGQRLLMMDYFSWYLSFMILSTQLLSFFALGLGLRVVIG